MKNLIRSLILVLFAASVAYADTLHSSLQPTNLKQVAGAAVATGHGTASGAIRVEIANDGTGVVGAAQSGSWTVAATQSGTWNINDISGTVSLPTGAATAAKQPALGVAGTASADVITVQGIVGATAVKVDGSAVTQPISGTVTVTDGAGALNVIVDSGTTTVTQGTGTNLHTVVDSGTVTVSDGSGALNVIVDSGTTAVTQATASNLNAQVVGNVAEDSAASGNPVTIGVSAQQGDKTAVTSGDIIRPVADLLGKLISYPYAQAQRTFTGVSTHTSDTSAKTLRGAQGTGVRNYVVAVNVYNSSSTNTRITISDGTTSFVCGAPANDTAYCGLPVPWRAVGDTAVTATCADSVASVYVTASMFDAAN